MNGTANEPKRFYGKYRGLVINNLDPEKLGRIMAEVPAISADPTDWALPSMPVASVEGGHFAVPGIGACVWIEFEGGDTSFPIWSGTFYLDPALVPPMALIGPPTQMVLQTTLGNVLVLDDDLEGITLQTESGASIRINAEGITLMTEGALLSVTDAGIEMAAGESVLSVTEEGISINSLIVAINEGALTVLGG